MRNFIPIHVIPKGIQIVTKSCLIAILLMFVGVKVNAQNLVNFNNASDWANNFNSTGTGFTTSSTVGLGNSGGLNVSTSVNALSVFNTPYSVGPVGTVYTVSSYFYYQYNNGYGSIGFTKNSNPTLGSFSNPTIGIGMTFHGGGGFWMVDNTIFSSVSWGGGDIALGNWYKMILTITSTAANTYNLNFKVYNSDANGNVGSLRANQTITGLANLNFGSASNTYSYFSANNTRVSKIDDFSSQVQAPVICNAPTIPTLTSTVNPICTGGTTTLSVASGNLNSATNWNWYSGSCGGSSIGSGTSISVSPTSTTTYYVRGEGNCVTPGSCGSITVTVNPNPTASATNNNVSCSGETLSLGSNGGTSYSWAGPNGFTSNDQNPSLSNVTTAASGTYTVTVTSNSGCTSTATTSVTINALPTATASSDSPVDAGGTLNLTSSGGTSYSWSGPNGFASSLQSPSLTNVTTAASGNYTVTVMLNGCSANASTSVTINELVSIPDANLLQALINNGVSAGENGISVTEAQSFTGSLNLENANISDLSGIEEFINITSLNCSGNNLTTLDVSQNTSLTSLDCSGNNLTTIDISQNTALTNFDCSENNLTTLDVSLNTSLTSLDCSGNSLTTLDVSKNTSLTSLKCSNNLLSNLDVSKNINLISLDCSENKLSNMDLSKNSNLSNLKILKNIILSLDLSMNTKLTDVDCSNNKISILDVSNNTELTKLDCSNNELTNLTVSNGNNINLTNFAAKTNLLKCIQVDDVSYSTANWKNSVDDGVYFSKDCSCINPSIPTLSASSNVICAGASTVISIAAGQLNSANEWIWYSGSCGGTRVGRGNFIVVSPTTTTNYFARGEEGCVTPDVCAEISITVNQKPMVTASNSSPICEGGTVNLTSTSGTSYSWTGPNGFTSTVQNPTIINASRFRSGTYSVRVTNEKGCSETASTLVTINSRPSASIASLPISNFSVCDLGGSANIILGYGGGASTITLSGSAIGGTPGYSYSWSPAIGLSNASIANPVFTPSTSAASATYSFTLTVTDVNGCTSKALTSVKVANVTATGTGEGKGDKVAVCHKGKLLSVAAPAVSSMLSQGGCLGSCGAKARLTSDNNATTIEGVNIEIVPNPFSYNTIIRFSLPSSDHAKLEIYDLCGRKISTLMENDVDAEKTYSVEFNGEGLSEGIYVYKLITSGTVHTGRILFIK